MSHRTLLALTTLTCVAIAGPVSGDEWSVENLIARLEHDDPQLRSAAARRLGHLLYKSRVPADQRVKVAAALVRALSDEDSTVRSTANRALEHTDREAVPYLLDLLGTGDADAQARAVVALGPRLGPNAPERARVLAMLDDSAPQVRGAIAKAFGFFAGRAQTSLLIARLKDPHGLVRRRAAQGLAEIVSPAVVSALHGALADPEPRVRRAAADALGRMTNAASAAVPGLVRALGDPDPRVRYVAAYALGEIGPNAAPGIPQLVGLLDSTDEGMRACAANALGKIGVGDPAALERLEEMMHHDRAREFNGSLMRRPREPNDPDPDQTVECYKLEFAADEAALAIAQMGPDGLAILHAGFDIMVYPVRRAIVRSISTAGAPAYPILADGLSAYFNDVAGGSRSALVRAGPAALPALAGVLQSDKRRQGQEAFRVMQKIGRTTPGSLAGYWWVPLVYRWRTIAGLTVFLLLWFGCVRRFYRSSTQTLRNRIAGVAVVSSAPVLVMTFSVLNLPGRNEFLPGALPFMLIPVPWALALSVALGCVLVSLWATAQGSAEPESPTEPELPAGNRRPLG